ncbi:hypothetical protein HW132_30250 [Brasilonema sp. CT11]|nr:hypothetical protein [Brasilonema sp. CT11]
MTNDKPEDIHLNNERSLKQLAWAIEASVGQFKLILARCNYASLRSHLIKRLRDICQVEIRVLVLKESARTLYTAIREECGDDVQALMILGLESVRNLEQMLISANQVREEFRNHFPFPVVLWIDDEVHKQFMQFAPDLESWGTTKIFPIAPNELMEFLQETAEQLLTGDFSLTLEKCSEIKLAWQDLQNFGQVLEPGVKARIEYLLGLTEYVDNHLDTALEYYQQSLAFWQQVNDLVWQGKVLSDITFCYYEKARQQEINRPVIASETKSNQTIGPNVSTPDWQETRNYLLAEKFNTWAQNYVDLEVSEWCAADGKSIKGTVKHYDSSSQNFVSIVSIFACKRGLVVGMEKFENQQKSEIQVVQDLITALDLQGVVFSFDSLHCQKKLAK